ncbi:hypothetical protein [Micromonospora maritima]|uniref:hypothetical protein n=1 Tax=Micromonospora maritima TaxID=986711 RepID=UPI00157DCCD9|nr:hypothetical protein [Micromonospora maritima]
MPHSFGATPRNDHPDFPGITIGLDQSNTRNEGRRVRNCDGKEGVIKPGGAHCTYGATVSWDDGTTYYTDTACLMWADEG